MSESEDRFIVERPLRASARRRLRGMAQLAMMVLVATACSQTSATSTTTNGTIIGDPTCGESFSSQRLDMGVGQLSDVGGLVASRRHSGVVWLVGRAPGGLRLWAVGSDDGPPLGWVALPKGVDSVIDVAIGPAPGADGDFLYLALSVGEGDDLTVMRINEPDPTAPAIDGQPTRLEYTSAGPRLRATALMVDGAGGDLYVVAGGNRGSVIYRAPAQPAADGVGELAVVASVGTAVTGADISPTGDAIVFRTNFDIAIWERQPGQDIAAAITVAPCLGQIPDATVATAIGFDSTGSQLRVVHPGLQPSMTHYAIPPFAGDDLDETRAGNLAPTVTITDPAVGVAVIEGLPLEIGADVEDDTAVEASSVRWTLEARQCGEDGICVTTDLMYETGNPITVTPVGASSRDSEFVITVTYLDDFSLTATETRFLPLQLPEPIPGSSVTFVDGSVDVGDIQGLTGDLSLEMWVQPTDLSAMRFLVGKAYSGEGMVLQETNGQMTYYHGESGGNCCPEDGSYVRIGSGIPLSLNEWTHVAITREVSTTRATIQFFIDGVPVTSATTTKLPAESSVPWILGGGRVDGVSTFVGGLDEVAIYDRVLSGAEVRSHIAAIGDPGGYGQLILDDAPIAFWRLDEPRGTVARDETGTWDGRYSGDLVRGEPGAGTP